jgi:hypothetical protein
MIAAAGAFRESAEEGPSIQIPWDEDDVLHRAYRAIENSSQRVASSAAAIQSAEKTLRSAAERLRDSRRLLARRVEVGCAR